MFDKKRLLEILNEFSRKKIAVIGDLMLDEYIIGTVTRISPEAPVPVVNVKKENFVLGGAANVVNNLNSLGVKVIPFGVIGNDNNGKKMLDEFNKKDVSTEYLNILNDRPTIMKQRILANNQQLLRLDWEKKHPINEIEEDFILDNLKRIILDLDAIILSDYDKGVLTERVAKEIIALAKTNKKIVVVDPKPSNSLNYMGATAMTPNLKESAECIAKEIPETDEKTMEIGLELREKLDLNHLLMTRSEKGMSIFLNDGSVSNIPTFAKEVYDVTGAGDTVISVYTLALSCGASYDEAAKIANTAAGIVVGRVGTSVVSVNEIIDFFEEVYNSTVVEE